MVIVSSVTTPRQVVLSGCLTLYVCGVPAGGPARSGAAVGIASGKVAATGCPASRHPASAQRTWVPQRQRTAQQPLPAHPTWRNTMAKTSPGPTQTAAGEQHLHRAIGLPGLTMINVGGIIGSGWLLGALSAAKVAGGGAAKNVMTRE